MTKADQMVIVFQSVSLCFSLSVCVSVCQSVFQSVSLCFSLSVCVSVCQSVFQSVSLCESRGWRLMRPKEVTFDVADPIWSREALFDMTGPMGSQGGLHAMPPLHWTRRGLYAGKSMAPMQCHLVPCDTCHVPQSGPTAIK